MARIELSDEERTQLHEVLVLRLHDLRREIHHTDQRDFKTRLRREEELLFGLLSKLEELTVHA